MLRNDVNKLELNLIDPYNAASVIEQANKIRYGSACYFYSRDIGRIWRVAEALDYGYICFQMKSRLEDFVKIKYLYMGL